MKKILFPTDFSNAAENAFGFAVALAQKLQAKIDLVSVYHLPFIDAPNVPPDYFIHQMMEEKRLLIDEKLKQFTQDYPQSYIGEKIPVYGIFIPEEITDMAKEKKYDLIIMGTRGEHHSAIEKIIGSITTNTMMRAKCPVLAIPEDCEWKDIKSIVFATDFEPKDMMAMEQLKYFSEKVGADIHCVHVETKPGIGNMEDFITLANYPYNFTDFAVVNSPSVIEGLDKYIREKSVDLIALFIPRRRVWEQLFHSSFTKRMTFHSRTPLLVFHE